MSVLWVGFMDDKADIVCSWKIQVCTVYIHYILKTWHRSIVLSSMNSSGRNSSQA